MFGPDMLEWLKGRWWKICETLRAELKAGGSKMSAIELYKYKYHMPLGLRPR